MDNDFFSIKNFLAVISAPLTFILGLIGWHYKNVYHKVEEIDQSTQKLQILVHEHSIYVNHLNDSVNKLDNKIDLIFDKLEGVEYSGQKRSYRRI